MDTQIMDTQIDDGTTAGLSDGRTLAITGLVFLCLIIVLGVVYNRDKEKPDSPHAMVAAGFTRMLQIQEWKPGMGTQPLVYHPAAATSPMWRPLPSGWTSRAGAQPGSTTVLPAQTHNQQSLQQPLQQLQYFPAAGG